MEEDILAFKDLFSTDSATLKDESFVSEFEKNVLEFNKQVAELELKSLLSGEHDHRNAYLSIYAGAGGTDAQDWAEMLLRMYSRWAEKKGFVFEILDQSSGDEAGIKSVTCIVKGEFAFGFLSKEQGVHRLVRLSPFNANNKRQTSFAAIEVIPEVDMTVSSVSIDPKDLKIDTFRASGAGGQHVNKTDSAVRIRHVPTGIVVSSQASRSQSGNKQTAMAILTARLLRLMQEQKKEEVAQLKGDHQDNAWGSQIRNYVIHPYKLVKDTRSGFETTDVSSFLDGDLDDVIYSLLLAKDEAFS